MRQQRALTGPKIGQVGRRSERASSLVQDPLSTPGDGSCLAVPSMPEAFRQPRTYCLCQFPPLPQGNGLCRQEGAGGGKHLSGTGALGTIQGQATDDVSALVPVTALVPGVAPVSILPLLSHTLPIPCVVSVSMALVPGRGRSQHRCGHQVRTPSWTLRKNPVYHQEAIGATQPTLLRILALGL